jgi:hypothetical protein
LNYSCESVALVINTHLFSFPQLGREGRNTNLVADLAKVRPLALQYIKPTQKLTQMEAPTTLNLGFLEKV